MSFLTFFDKLSPGNWSTIAGINKGFPNPVERYDTITRKKSTVSVYEAIREIQHSVGKSFDDGWAHYAIEFRNRGVCCTGDGRILFTMQRADNPPQ